MEFPSQMRIIFETSTRDPSLEATINFTQKLGSPQYAYLYEIDFTEKGSQSFSSCRGKITTKQARRVRVWLHFGLNVGLIRNGFSSP